MMHKIIPFFVLFLGLLPGVSMATDVYHYAASKDAVCSSADWRYEMRLQNNGKAIELELYNRPRGFAYREHNQSAVIPLSSVVDGAAIIKKETLYYQVKIAGLDGFASGGDVVLTPLDYNGEVHENCEAVTLKPISSPEERFQVQLDLLNTDPITADIATKVLRSKLDEPTIAWLPALSQQGMKDKLEATRKSFWPRFEAAITEMASNPNLTSEQVVGLYADVKSAWDISVETYDRPSLQSYLDNIVILWSIRHRNDPTTAQVLAINSAEELCERVDGFPSYDWVEKFRLATGVPVELWTQDFANQIIEWGGKCDSHSVELFVQDITRQWPKIELMSEAYLELNERVDALLALPVTAHDFKANNWLEFPRDDIANSVLHSSVFERLEEHVLRPHLAASLPALIADLEHALATSTLMLDQYSDLCEQRLGFTFFTKDSLKESLQETCNTSSEQAYQRRLGEVVAIIVAQAEKQLADETISLQEIVDFCRMSGAEYGAGDYRVSRDFGALCQPELAAIATRVGKQRIDDAVAVVEAAPLTLEGFANTNGFSVDSIELLDGYFSADAFQASQKSLIDYRDKAEEKMVTIRKKADIAIHKVLSEDFTQQMASGSTVEALSAVQATIDAQCQSISTADQLPLSAKTCQDAQAGIADKIHDINCKAVWSATEFPERLKTMQVQTNSESYKPLVDVLCGDEEIVGITDAGFFSSDYRLQAVHSGGKSQEDLLISVRLVEPKKGDVLSYDDLTVSTGKIDTTLLAQYKYPLVVCLVQPHLCVKPN